jgi:stalled ribosome rescue protein Dom34
MVSYGEAEVKRLLAMAAVDTLLLSESLDDDVIEHFETEAQKYGSTVKIISVDTREGQQLKEMGKVAALLRYEA